LDQDFIHHFNEANVFGLNNLENVIGDYKDVPFDLKQYYTQYIKFKLDDDKLNALKMFLSKLKS
jgi:hypothetical protein